MSNGDFATAILHWDETTMRRSIMHALTPLLILCARIVIAQAPTPSAAIHTTTSG